MLCWLLNSTSNAMRISMENGQNKFEARNSAQVYKARDLSRAYAEYYAFISFQRRISSGDVLDELKPVLHSLLVVYAFWCLEKHLPTFYQGSFATRDTFAEIVRQQLLQSCAVIKDNAVSVADSLAPPDFALNSVLGKSDGLVSNHNFTKVSTYMVYI